MGIFTKILGGAIKPLAEVGGKISGHFAATKQAKIESALQIAKAKTDYKLAKLQAKTQRVLTKEQNDATYDMQVLRNREHTYADEFLIASMMLIFFMHFVTYTQPYMRSGWQAMGYDGEIVHTDARPADVIRHMACTAAAEALIGEVAPTPLEEGLRRTIAWHS